MKLIRTDENNKVVYTHFKPEILNEDDRANGFLIEDDAIPAATPGENQISQLFYDAKTKTFSYTYEAIVNEKVEMQKTIDALSSKVVEQEAAITMQNDAIADLTVYLATMGTPTI
ncbi:hypothetical protein [Kurthia sp. Dielmo]|uniref:hypothetical protein n=1 Tax=Kurthia sp. Dielmo TaxID=1033738 RepID=UPI00111DCB98|nr:hypothetical protein [Kurthia sp. Dielmo]